MTKRFTSLACGVAVSLIFVLSVPATLIVNGDFEDASGTFPNGWVNTPPATAETTSPISGTTSARMGWNTTGNLDQSLAAPVTDFEMNLLFQHLGTVTGRTLNTILQTAGSGSQLNLRVLAQGVDGSTDDSLQVYNGSWQTISTADFFTSTTEPYRITIRGHNWGTPTPTYDVLWSDAGSSTLSYSATGLSYFQNSAPTAGGVDYIRFARPYANGHTWLLDDVSLESTAIPEPHTLVLLLVGLAGVVVRQFRHH